jgi:histidinol-phosphatase
VVDGGSWDAELAFALEMAELGGRTALEHYGRSPKARRKDDGTWVTEADQLVEKVIRGRIADAWPGHNIFGEEQGLAAGRGGTADESAPTWVVDPIDGTNNFMAEIPIWATLIAFRSSGTNVLGVACAPALGETYDAAEGRGARLNGEPIHVASVDTLADAFVVSSGLEAFHRRGLDGFLTTLTARSFRSRGLGDFWGHMLVARGAAHIMVETDVALWDVAALEPIVTEAGGRISRLDGTPWREAGSCLTTCGSLHDEVLGLVAAAAPGHREP